MTSLFVVVIDLLMVILCIQYFYAALGYELFGSTEVTKSQLLFGDYVDGGAGFEVFLIYLIIVLAKTL